MIANKLNFPIGTYFYYQHDSLYYAFQLIDASKKQLLVVEYWSTTQLPSMENLAHLDVKSACTDFQADTDEMHAFGFSEVTSEQQQEIEQYLKIKTAKKAREAGFLTLKQEALDAIAKEDYEEGVRLLSLAAPYNKYDVELYEERGKCYYRLGNYSDALVDLEYYLTFGPPKKEILALVDEIKNRKKS